MKKSEQPPFVNHIYESANPKKGKTIVIFHGWGSSVFYYEEFAKKISALGFRVVVPEIVFHDSRNGLDNHFTKESTQQYFWKTIFTSIDGAESLIRELQIQKEEIILLGISMGGFIANGIHAADENYAGLININGSGSFLLSECIFREDDNRPPLPTEEIGQMNFYDPIRKRQPSSPVLLMHGEQDSVVSIKGQEDYYTYLSQELPAPDVIFQKYKGINHTFSEEMNESLIHWLEERY